MRMLSGNSAQSMRQKELQTMPLMSMVMTLIESTK